MIDRPKQPPRLDDEDDDEFGNFQVERPTTPAGEAAPDDRPTVSPPFDLEEYAKESDSKMMTSPTAPPNVSKAPPVPDFDGKETASAWGMSEPPRPRAKQSTLTDEGETEEARLRSVLMQSEAPPARRRAQDNIGQGLIGASRKAMAESEEPPATQAYPSEYERDPFAHLSPDSGGGKASEEARQLGDMRDRASLGDYTGALEIAEAVLARDPGSIEAERCAEECRAKLIHMYTARVGPLDRVPVVMVAREQLRWLSIDHRAGFLLSHIDGVSSLEMILDVSGMPLLDALKILAELQQQRVISFR